MKVKVNKNLFIQLVNFNPKKIKPNEKLNKTFITKIKLELC